ncbi:MAG TPA: FtsX-like permease family protein [Micromonosporaceae bacterium]|nr:FtsX-like permease family protein [Micromonosporaceae bacterium]
MVGLVFSALRERRSQAVSIFILTILTALGGCAAPWFSAWAHEAVAAADISAAPVTQRLVTVTGQARNPTVASAPMTQLHQLVGSALPLGSDVVVAMNLLTQVNAAKPQTGATENSTLVTLGSRENVCAHLTIDGACPTASEQVVIGRRIALAMGVGVGDRITFTSPQFPRPVLLTVSGLYEIADPLDPYWARAASSDDAFVQPLDQVAFVTEQAVLVNEPRQVDLLYQLVLGPSAFHDGGTPLLHQLADAQNRLQPAGLAVNATANIVVDQIRGDQSLVTTGVDLATVQLVLLGWFALYLAVRYTSDPRRRDIGLLKLRGTARWRIWAIIAMQSAIPMIAGAVVGLGLGRAASIALAGSAADPGGVRALVTSLVVAGAFGLGALLVCVSAEARALNTSILTLIRRAPNRRTGWRTELGDLLVVVVAVAGVYQGYADLHAGGRPSAFALLAPGLVGLAVAVLAARALPFATARGGQAALRAGRAGLALIALHVARRTGTQRVFVVIAVAVSVLSTTLFFWQSADDAWSRRALAELGAARVLTVRAQNSTVLLADVRSADPTGRYAMAVARGNAATTNERVLAIDTTRLAAVADLSPELGLPAAAKLARLLRPTAPVSAVLTDGAVTIEATGSTQDPGATIVMDLVDSTGGWRSVTFGPLTADAPGAAATIAGHPPAVADYPATVTGCAAGCRLAAFELGSDRQGVAVTLSGLTQAGRTVISTAEFGDIAHWRPPTGPSLIGPDISAGSDGLTVSAYRGEVGTDRVDPHVYLAAVPTPMPVVLVGDLTDSTSRPGDARLVALGTEPVAYSVVATGRLLPRLETAGALMDLQYAELSNSGPSESVGLEVWLTADAPSSIVDALRRDGIEVVADDSTAAYVGRLRAQGPGAALRFEIFAAIVLLVVAAATVAVSAAVERRPRAEELAALRAQGLTERTVRRVVYGGTGVLAVAAVAVGLLAALVAQAVVATSLPVFSDSWSLLPVRGGPWASQLILALAASLVVLAAAAWPGAARTVRSTLAPARTGGEV